MTAPTPDEFRRAMAMVPSAVTVVTADGDAHPSGATANAVVALSLEPLLMLASLHRESRTLAAVARAGRFAINVLASGPRGARPAVLEPWPGRGEVGRRGLGAGGGDALARRSAGHAELRAP